MAGGKLFFERLRARVEIASGPSLPARPAQVARRRLGGTKDGSTIEIIERTSYLAAVACRPLQNISTRAILGVQSAFGRPPA